MPLPPPTRPHSSRALSAGPSSGIFASPSKKCGRKAEKDWDDAWDSSSDHEDIAVASSSTSGQKRGDNKQSSETLSVGRSRECSDAGDGAKGVGEISLGLQDSSLNIMDPWELVENANVTVNTTSSQTKVGANAVRSDVYDVLRDPLRLLKHLASDKPSSLSSSSATSLGQPESHSCRTTVHPSTSPADTSWPTTGGSSSLNRQRSMRTERRRETFAKVLSSRDVSAGGVDVAELRRQAWSGIPSEVRPIAWQLLLNYLPLANAPRLATLRRKRNEYRQLVEQHFGVGASRLDPAIWHQIKIDVPRTRPGVILWSCDTAQRCLERILYIWAIRHPASGYVQGINDLATPFFQVFLGAYIDADPEEFDAIFLEADVLSAIEADSFWCLAKLLDGIQDNYITAQPGIQRQVKRMCELVQRIEPSLAAHLEDQGIEYMQFAFRWMNCLLMREISIKCTIRMWDTYLAEGADAFSQFHLYVCSALLIKWSDVLKSKDFQGIIMFLQNLPTQDWTDHDVALLLSEAFVLKATWHGAENHFAKRISDLPGMTGGMGGR